MRRLAMRKKIVCVLAVAVGSIAFAASAEEDHSEWALENCVDAAGKPTTKIANGAKCELKNKRRGECLIRVANPGQTDWDFAPCSKHPKSASIQKEGGGAIKCGDTVALELGLGGENHTAWYRKCVNPQTVGINVCQDLASAPEKKHFEWQLKCSGDVEENKAFGLHNTARKDDIVYAKRPSKMVDTCWAGKVKLGQCITVKDD
jgi:hypothetical protein